MLQISVESKDLARAIGVVSRVINRRNTCPILDNVLLSQKDGDFFITGSNGDAWGTWKMPKDSVSAINGADTFSKICLPAETMKQILASCPDQRLTCDIDEQQLMMTVTYQTGQFSVPVVNADEYPVARAIDKSVCSFNLQGGWLVPQVRAAKVCVQENNLRPVMSNIALDVDYEGVNIVGTDGQTFYKDRLQVGVGSGFLEGEPCAVLLHQRVFDIILAAFASAENIRVETNGQLVTLTSDDFSLIFRSTEGTYPKYERIIPTQQPYHVTVDVAALVAALRRVAIFASEASNMVILSWKEGGLVLEASDADFGQAACETVPSAASENNMPDGFRIGLKAASLLSLLGCAGAESAVLEFSESNRPVTIREEDANSLMVLLLMPMIIEGQ